MSAHSFIANGLSISHPIALSGSSLTRTSYTSVLVNSMLVSCKVGVFRQEIGGST